MTASVPSSRVRHFVLPDTQIRPGDKTEFLTAIGSYVVDKKPEVVVCLGDFADMPSLSTYDQGKKSFEGRRYTADVEAVKEAMQAFMKPFVEYNDKARKNKEKLYKPRFVMTLGNHEHRINRAVNDDPKLEGLISPKDLGYAEAGWEVYNFLDVVVIDGVCYSHYFVTGAMGRPCSSAAIQLSKKHQSCIAGHQQGLQVAMGHAADGRRLTSVIAGSCLAPHHKVLTADLRYIPLSEIRVGDELVSFDESLGMSAKRSRRYKTGTVLNTRISTSELFDVALSSGKVFRTTKDHRWLTNNCIGVRKWMETQRLRKGPNGTKVNRLFEEWETDSSRDAGWLAGMYDGEGSLYKRKTTGGNCTQLSISQSYSHNPEVCEELIEKHRTKGFSLGSDGGKLQKGWRISGGQAEIARFLGTIRPERMIRKFTPECLGTLTSQYPKELEHIVSVEPVGIGEYVEIEIDAKTMVVEGYPHHNCYEHDEDYMGPQGNKHWRGCLMLHEVSNGEFDLMNLSLDYLKNRYEKRTT